MLEKESPAQLQRELSAREVADFFLRAAETDQTICQPMTNMRLQKLLYYAQGWSLALTEEPLFDDEIRAWKHGPAVPSVYQQYKSHGNRRLSTHGIKAPILAPSQSRVLRSVWATYGHKTAGQLRTMTHNELPWLLSRQGYGEGDRCEVVLSNDVMRDFFRGRLRSRKDRRLNDQRRAYAENPTTELERAVADESIDLIAAS